jgi:hypothetical protein
MSDSIVIMERGSRWPAWVDRQAGPESNVAVFSQQPDEELFDFHARALEHLCSSSIVNRAKRAVLVCSGLFGEDEAKARHDLLLALAMMVCGADSAQVVLVADGDSARRSELLGMAFELNLELDRRDVPVSIMLRAAPRRPSLPAPAAAPERRVA